MNHEKTELDFLNLVGFNIKKYRLRKAWSQETLGLEIGMTRMQVSQMEKAQISRLSRF